MGLGLYHKPIINFQESKSKGTSWWMYVKILICSEKCWKIQLQRQFLHICHAFFRSTLFSFNPSIFFVPARHSALHVLINNNNHMSIMFWDLVSVKDEKVFLFFSKLCLKISFEYYNAYKFHFMRSLFEGNFIQNFSLRCINLLFWCDSRSELGYSFSH